MTLPAGMKLGAYEIRSALGAGGMGEVYRAHDSKLGRDVAVKILPESFAQDPERIGRFNREAHVLASLNHPHIAAIYGLEQDSSTQFLVLELVDGETLAQKQRTGESRGLPIAEALTIARQIAEALEAAHEKGIIHRDLKPANIALTAADQVKILDFGLSKALEGSGSDAAMNSPTLTAAATRAGVILGTAAYMSPEQAKGRVADKRSDVWAFGCVLYEMLTGKRAFEGEDVSDTLASVLRGEPDWNALPASLPAPIRALIVNCLQKDRKQRIGDFAVVRYVLAAPQAVTPAAAATPAPRGRFTIGFWAAAAASLAVAAGAGWLVKPASQASERTVTRFPIPVSADQRFIPSALGRHVIAISPDGTHAVYAVNSQLYLRAFDQLEAAPIRGTNESPYEPFYSSDGQWIGYYANGHLKKIPIGGGAPTTLCEAGLPWGVWWDGDRVLFGAGPDGIFEVPAGGGMPKLIISAKPSEFLHGPQLLPGGRAVLFTIGSAGAVSGGWSNAAIAVESLETSERKVLVRGGTDAHYVSTGHLIYGRDGVLFANAFDIAKLELRGGPMAMIEGVATAGGGLTGAMQLAISPAGTVAYLPSTPGAMTTLAWRGRDGVDTPIAAPPHAYSVPRVSPDGTRIAVHATDQDNDIWVWDTRNETLTRLTFDKGVDGYPVWTRDGSRVIYVSSGLGTPNLAWKMADGTGQPEVLMQQPPASNGALVLQMTPFDGKSVVYSVGVPARIELVPLEGERNARALLSQPGFHQRGGDVSPDGRWMAYYSDESGVFQVYVRPFPDVDSGRWQVSADGGTLPKWNPKGGELFYIDGKSRLVSVNVASGATFSFGKATVLWDASDTAPNFRNYDPSPDGTRFAVAVMPRLRGTTQFVVVQNWIEELKQRLPANP
jgi:serine/threonine-protein kinase